MYIPSSFREDRPEYLEQCMRDHPLATLVINGPEGLMANHIPMLFERAGDSIGVLCGHIARANPLAQLGPDLDALAIFQGEQGYISPSWYQTKAETGRVVPTWNYVVVHAHGKLHTYDDPARLRCHLENLTATHESLLSQPWKLRDAPDDYISGLLTAIVGIELRISRLAGKWKLSQNRPAADRTGAIDGLRRQGEPRGSLLAAYMEQYLLDRK